MPRGIYERKPKIPKWYAGETKRCGKCLIYKNFSEFSIDVRRNGGLNYACRVCDRERVRIRNKQHPRVKNNYQSRRQYHLDYQKRYKEENPEKKQAQILVNEAVKKGTLKREPCVVCGKEKSVGHHPDYSKPLCVIWYCQKHHMLEHLRLNSSPL